MCFEYTLLYVWSCRCIMFFMQLVWKLCHINSWAQAVMVVKSLS